MSDALKAGAAVMDITPTQFPVNMPGGHSSNMATGVHDPLNARALVLDDGKTKVVWVVIDHLSVPRKVTVEAKEIASKATGIPVENMVVSATHTHTGVSAADEFVVEVPGGPKLSDRQAKANAYRQVILDGIRKRWPWVKHLFADGAYDRLKLMDKAAYLDFVIEVIRRSDDQKGFQVLPRRWVVERTFGWMTRWRRLVRDYEARIDVSQAMILVAMGGNLLRRNAHP